MDVAKKIISAFALVWFFSGLAICAVGMMMSGQNARGDDSTSSAVLVAGISVAVLGAMLGLVSLRLGAGGDRPNAPMRSKS